jgi:hypothetical protein
MLGAKREGSNAMLKVILGAASAVALVSPVVAADLPLPPYSEAPGYEGDAYAYDYDYDYETAPPVVVVRPPVIVAPPPVVVHEYPLYAVPPVYAAPPAYAYAGPGWHRGWGWGHRHHFREDEDEDR